VAEQTKASAATPIEFDSLATGGIFGQVMMSGEQVPPSPTRAWQIPTGAPSKILPNTHV